MLLNQHSDNKTDAWGSGDQKVDGSIPVVYWSCCVFSACVNLSEVAATSANVRDWEALWLVKMEATLNTPSVWCYSTCTGCEASSPPERWSPCPASAVTGWCFPPRELACPQRPNARCSRCQRDPPGGTRTTWHSISWKDICERNFTFNSDIPKILSEKISWNFFNEKFCGNIWKEKKFWDKTNQKFRSAEIRIHLWILWIFIKS